jgi:hypothetical protein
MTDSAKKSVIEEILEPSELCFIKEGSIVFRIEDKEVYDVHLSKCDTYPKIIGWVIHLSEKTWMTSRLLFFFNSDSMSSSRIGH